MPTPPPLLLEGEIAGTSARAWSSNFSFGDKDTRATLHTLMYREI